MPGGVKTDVKTYQMYVNGEFVASKSNKTFPVFDPSTEEVIAQVPDAGPRRCEPRRSRGPDGIRRRTLGLDNSAGTRTRSVPSG